MKGYCNLLVSTTTTRPTTVYYYHPTGRRHLEFTSLSI